MRQVRPTTTSAIACTATVHVCASPRYQKKRSKLDYGNSSAVQCHAVGKTLCAYMYTRTCTCTCMTNQMPWLQLISAPIWCGYYSRTVSIDTMYARAACISFSACVGVATIYSEWHTFLLAVGSFSACNAATV